jgi:hypothetical protein
MNEKSYRNIAISAKNQNYHDLSEEIHSLGIESPANSKTLINALDKYEQAVKRYIDPEINREETILIVSALIEKLANSLPQYIEEDQGIKQGIKDLIQEVREKGFLTNHSLNQPFMKFLVGITATIQQIFVKTFSFIKSTIAIR